MSNTEVKYSDPNEGSNINEQNLNHLSDQIKQNAKYDDVQTNLPPRKVIDMTGYQLNNNSVTGGASKEKSFTIFYKNSKKHLTGKSFKNILEKYHQEIIAKLKKTHFTFTIQDNKTKESKKYEAAKESIRHPKYKFKTTIKEVNENNKK